MRQSPYGSRKIRNIWISGGAQRMRMKSHRCFYLILTGTLNPELTASPKILVDKEFAVDIIS